mgnify:CR=1 FL=1
MTNLIKGDKAPQVNGIDENGSPISLENFKGKKVIAQFLSWIEQLECGTDLMTQKDYRVI